MGIKTIEWSKGAIKLIDQTKLPGTLKYIYIKNIVLLRQAIRMMKTRGAPALGAAAGLGVYLGIKDSKAKNFRQFKEELDKVIKYLAAARPTARNLFWGLERARKVVLKNKGKPIRDLKKIILTEAKEIIEEDMSACRRIGHYGAKLIKKNDTILTICNAGILATIDYGTALGVIYRCKEEGKSNKVYACETRPMLQGARLTTWELSRNGIDVTLICDNMAATLMKQGKIDRVIAGADRIASNGDTANKIGTYNLAVLCNFHKIPFYIAAPVSTFDLKIKSGEEITIEERGSPEMTSLFFKKPIALNNVKVFHPAFDVTPHDLISAIITEKGVIRHNYKKNIRRIIGK
ncbi:MAG: S-methyl-5-thioribose-1-phosphate isomerase [Candidatus Omnitrophota bacterium]|nr:S-methyl-5-thioribose-1-phosphate isomerase [Candidatus Omnitrophota bacterium]MBU2034604.1 S-methyl-5-thioribose-1-phosphate isomerase [Candidatus Omnitrophota bacterium]MBU2221975.1 S-methyl-5-thioribose-1-phosphate isomerase [Candidatus Omnitrophota bacterium]MBU2257900.1 S-methyl-5-thioribose-1-phosphate isomerase [Candidatus Omnitrophota bacterium]